MLCTLYSLLSFSCLVHIVNCQTQTIYVAIQVPSQVNYHRDKLPFACTPSDVGSDSISDISLQKNYSTGWQDVVKVYLDTTVFTVQNKVLWIDTNMQNRASVNMSVVAPTNGAGLRIEINADNVACTDEGNYRCSIGGNKNGGGKLDSQTTPARVGLIVQANSIESIQVNPRMPENIYNPGTAVSLTCTGDVGNPAGDLRWCIKREGIDISFTGYPNSADISQGSAWLSGCQYRRSSTLTYNVSSTIPEVDFRCETGPMATCGLSSTLAANFTLIRFQPYVNLQAPASVVYQKDKIIFTCSPTNVAGADTISDIILQKNTTIYSWQDLVRVYTDTSTGQLLQNVVWTDTNMQSRATVITSVTAPTNSAGLKIEISADHVACNDEGNYRCSISGNKAVGGKLDSQSTHVHVGLVASLGAVVGGVLGGIFALIAIVVIIVLMREQVYRRKKTLERRQKPAALSNSVISKKSNNEDIELGQTVNERSYESLGTKGIPNVYEHLTSESEINHAYQTLSEQEKPNVYAQFSKENEINHTYQTMGEKDKPNVYDNLSNQPVLDNDEYVNINI